MDIKNMLQGLSQGDDRKKKYIIIALIILFLFSLIGGTVYFLTTSKAPANNGDVLSGFEGMAPRDGVATSSLKRLPFIELAADHPTVSPGQESKISWVASNATSCVNGNGDAIDLTGSLSISPTEPYTFDVLCTGPNGTQSQTITIEVTTAPIIELVATPPAVLSGKQSYISWETRNADRCEDSTGATLRLSSGFSIKPTTAYTYSISCTGPKGTTKKSITVTIAIPFASNTGSGGSTGSNSGSGNTFTDGSNGNTFTDSTSGNTYTNGTNSNTYTSGGVTYNSDGTVYIPGITGSNTGNGTGIGSSQTFSATLSANPESNITFNGTTKITWKVTNLVSPDYCIIESTNKSKSYLPGLLSSYNLSKTVTTPALTSNETITLSCWKGSEKIVKSVTLSIGPKPPTPAPQITSFSVAVKNNSTKTYAPSDSELVAKWKTNVEAKVTGCVLERRTGNSQAVPVVGVQTINNAQNITGTTFVERNAGVNSYTLTCTGEGGVVTSAPQSGPNTLTIVDCKFPKGFGSAPDEVTGEIAGKVELISGKPVCTYTFGNPDGGSIHPLWGFAREIQPGSEKFLCPYTAYSAYRYPDGGLHTSGNQGLNTGGWMDTLYHPKWEYLKSTTYSHPTNCGHSYGLTYWVSYKAGYTATTTDEFGSSVRDYPAVPAHFEWNDIAPCGPPVVVVNSLTCLVK